jgi:hypothetical protein
VGLTATDISRSKIMAVVTFDENGWCHDVTLAPDHCDLWTETNLFGDFFGDVDRNCYKKDGKWVGMFREHSKPLAWRPCIKPPVGMCEE